MRILVVCGAGASSTFVAQRVRHAAHDAGLEWTALAGTEVSLPIDLDSADLILVGPHLSTSLHEIHHAAEQRGAAVALLPEDVYSDVDGSRTLAIVRETMKVPAPPAPATHNPAPLDPASPAPASAPPTDPPPASSAAPPATTTFERDPS